MKTLLLTLCLALATVLQAAEPRPDLKLINGAVLKAARIVSIDHDIVLVVHAGGTSEISADRIEVATLIAAQQEIAATAAADKKRKEAVATKDVARQQAARQAATAREKFTADDLAAKRRYAQEIAPVQLTQDRIIRLKADFPPQSSGTVRVRGVSIIYDVPSRDIWDWYRGTFATATMASVPRTLDLVAKRIDDDMQRLGRLGGGEAVRVQSEQTARWLVEVMQPYAAQWRGIAPPPPRK